MIAHSTGDGFRLTNIELGLGSKSTHFCCYVKPYADNDLTTDDERRLYILFEDSFEIDMLIKMLERFKARNVECWADWR